NCEVLHARHDYEAALQQASIALDNLDARFNTDVSRIYLVALRCAWRLGRQPSIAFLRSKATSAGAEPLDLKIEQLVLESTIDSHHEKIDLEASQKISEVESLMEQIHSGV